MDSTHAAKVLKKTLLDSQKRFPMYHTCPRNLATHCCGSAFPENGFTFHQDLDEGKTQVDWERGIDHCVLIQHLLNLSKFLNSGHEFINSVLISDQSSSRKFDCGPLKFLQFFHLIETFHMSFTKIPIPAKLFIFCKGRINISSLRLDSSTQFLNTSPIRIG